MDPAARLVRRVEPLDQLRDDQVALLLYGNRLVRLELLGMALFDDAATPVSLTALAGGLAERFGAPPDGSLFEATRSAVEDLVAQGVLAWQ